MNRGSVSALVIAFALGLTNQAAAHHPPKMERCESVTFSGEIERIEWRRPHVELFVRTDEGETFQLTWLAINQLALEGIEDDTLRIGDRVEIMAGVRPNDVVDRPLLLSYIHRNSDDWGWSQLPQGC